MVSPSSEGAHADIVPEGPLQVLVVDDDFFARRYFQLALERNGWKSVPAASVAEAQRILSKPGAEAFQCVLADYQMPGQTGLDLLLWLKARHPGLAAIIITADEEKEVVAGSLRAGAADFLNKAVKIEELLAAVQRAAVTTARHRQLIKTQSDVEHMGRMQERMIGAQLSSDSVQINFCFHPMHEAGGDFITQFELPDGRVVVLATDVSGHDLTAAYVSAYFHGMMRGMMERSASMPEVFKFFNRFLLHDWCRGSGGPARNNIISIAATSLLIDPKARTVAVLSCGFPLPAVALPSGIVKNIGEGAHPLGWFDDFPVQPTVHEVPPGAEICLWTDGLEDLAESLGVTRLSLAHALLRAKERGEDPAWLKQARDDILLGHIRLEPGQSASANFEPLIHANHSGDSAARIDELQAKWQRSLTLALPELSEARIFDMLLAAREAALNAFLHGCKGSATEQAWVRFSVNRPRRVVRVHVEDPGPGHAYDFTCDPSGGEDCAEKHTGLVLVKYLPGKLEIARCGAELIMEFGFDEASAAKDLQLHEQPADKQA